MTYPSGNLPPLPPIRVNRPAARPQQVRTVAEPVLIDDDDDLPWRKDPSPKNTGTRTARKARRKKSIGSRLLKTLLTLAALSAIAVGALFLAGYHFPKNWSDVTFPPHLSDFKADSSAETSVTEIAPVAPPPPPIPVVGLTVPVRDGDAQYVVTGVTYAINPPVESPDPAVPPPPPGATATVTMVVDNLGTSALPFDPASLKLRDNQNGEFVPAGVVQVGDDPAAPTPLPLELAPGGTLGLVVNYALPSGVIPSAVEVNDIPGTPGARITLMP